MATNKTISLAVTIRPFQVPNFVALVPKEPVSRSEEQPGIPLSDLDADTLYELCEEFTNAVFEKAKKQRPPVAYNSNS